MTHEERLSNRALATIGLALAGAIAASSAAAAWGLEVHGVVDAGVSRVWGDVDWSGYTPGERGYRQSNVFPSRLSIRADEDFGLGWHVGALLEHGFNGGTGRKPCFKRRADCRNDPWLNRARLIDARHYAYGRLRIGFQSALGRETADLAHPWAGETVATDDCAALLAWRCGDADRSEGREPAASCIDADACSVGRRSHAVRYDVPQIGGWTIALQHGLKPDQTHVTMRVGYQHGGTALSVSAIKVSRETQVYPMAASATLGGVRLHLSHTLGRGAVRERTYTFVGASTYVGRGELRAGVSRYRAEAGYSHDKAAIGWHRPLGHRVIAYADLAYTKLRDSDRSGRGVDAGLRMTF